MLKFKVTLTALVLIFSSTIALSQNDYILWNGNSEELENLILSNDENKKVFVLQKIIENPDLKVSVQLAYNIYELYRNHSNDQVRQMALVALYKTEYFFLLKNLKDDLYEEENPKIRYQITKILEKMPVLRDLN